MLGMLGMGLRVLSNSMNTEELLRVWWATLRCSHTRSRTSEDNSSALRAAYLLRGNRPPLPGSSKGM